MNSSSRNLIIALSIPIAALAGLVAYKSYLVHFGTEYILPIRGYDPRDLLSGHYLIYQIDYGVESTCPDSNWENTDPAFICLSTRTFSYDRPTDCKALIEGQCKNKRFIAGIERFFVPQEDARALENAVRGRQGSIVLSAAGINQVAIKELLIEGKPWRDFLREFGAKQ